MIFLKIIIVISCVIITIQDHLSRSVWWFVFPLLGISMGMIYYQNSQQENFLINCFINNVILLIIMALAILILKLKRPELGMDRMIGLGDILLFLAFSFGFPSMAFVIILVSSLIFSLVVHLVLRKNHQETVPLAGYSSSLLLLLFMVHWFGFYPQLYQL